MRKTTIDYCFKLNNSSGVINCAGKLKNGRSVSEAKAEFNAVVDTSMKSFIKQTCYDKQILIIETVLLSVRIL